MSTPIPIGWLVTNWRLKLLSFVLAIGLLSPVAFSENPPTLDTVSVRVLYKNLPKDLVIVNPTTSVKVDVAGFRDAVQNYRRSTAGVAIDLTHAHADPNQPYTATPRGSGVTFRQSSIPIVLTIEPLTTRQLDIAVQTSKKAPGIVTVPDKTYATCGNANDRCQVSVTGPVSVVGALEAYVDYDVPLNAASTGSSPNQPIQFKRSGAAIDLSKTLADPQVSWTPDFVTVLVTTQGGTQMKTVPISEQVVGRQPCGYQITSVDLQPNQVTVSGPVDAVSKITSVSMDPIVLTGLTGSERLTRTVITGANGVGAVPQQIDVSISVSQAFVCAAPTPTAGTVQAPTPTTAPSVTPGPSPSPAA